MEILHQPVWADEFCPRTVAELARRTLRQPGGIAHIANGLTVSSYTPKANSRIWYVEDAQGNVLAEQPSLYLAIHQVAR
jgi:hypothetical protein